MSISNELRDLKTSLRVIGDYNHFLHKKSPPLLPSIQSSKNDKKVASIHDSYVSYFGMEKNWDEMSPALWDFMLGPWAVKSFIDVGCGRGYTSKYFLDNGARVICVEGSQDAVAQSVLPGRVIREHDFTRGPWLPDETFDVAWSVEFVEHVGRQYMPNYFPIFKKSALIMVS